MAGPGLQWASVFPSLRLGKYVVEGLLGPGGVTETYLAHLAPEAQGESAQAMAGKLFALKLLRSDCVVAVEYAKVAQRFLAAGRQLRDFHRPGFGKVVDLSEDPAATFIVTEYVGGTDLARLVEQGRAGQTDGAVVDPVLAGLIGSEVAHLLHVGHSAKPILCHLGLVPQNVMIKETGEVALLDAGIASALRAITAQPTERWAFVAPELQGVDVGAVALSDRQRVAADLYALGALVHFLVTGHAPVVAPAQARRSRTTMADMPSVSSNLSAALRTLLSFDPEDRPESAAVLVDWLASDVDASRDRRQLIAEGLRAAETGALRASESTPAQDDQPAHAQPTIKPANRRGKAGESLRVVRTAATAIPSRRGRIIAGGILVAVLVVAGLGAMKVPGLVRGSKQTADVRDQAQRGLQSGHPTANPPGNAPADPKGGEEPRTETPASDESVLARVAGHLIVETVPPGATVWVDGVIQGKTFADIVVGEGGHRIVVIAPGHRMFRDVIDASRGAIVRRTLQPIEPSTRGNGFIDVTCLTTEKYPVLLDEEETGLLCPAKMLPTTAGKHTVGLFVPPDRRTVLVETTVEIGAKPTVVKFRE
jgi:serine/threonine protein kinase